MWHEARRSEKKVHDIMDAARKRAERRATFLAKKRGDPQQQLKISGIRCRMYHDQAMYQATEDQQGLIPWNGNKDNLIDRFDGRALLDFIREPEKTRRRQKSEEDEEQEELVNFERYRDLIKRRRRGFSDEQGLLDVDHADERRAGAAGADWQRTKGAYSQVGFSYDGTHVATGNDTGDNDVSESSSSSGDEETDSIGRDYGVRRYGWLSYMDKKSKVAEKKNKYISKGDTSSKKLSRKERRRATQYDRERGRYRFSSDPYRESRGGSNRSRSRRSRSRSRSWSRSHSRSRSRSRSKSRSRSHSRSPRRYGRSSDSGARRSAIGKIEYITEFTGDEDAEPTRGYSPPPSPPSSRVDHYNRPSGRLLEALHGDPATSTGHADHGKESASSLSKLSKGSGTQKGERKETPQERLKRIMSKQLNKQIKKDTVAELRKKREQEKLKEERLAEASSPSRSSRSRSRSPYK